MTDVLYNPIMELLEEGIQRIEHYLWKLVGYDSHPAFVAMTSYVLDPSVDLLKSGKGNV